MFVVTYSKYLIAIRATLSHSLKSVELFTVVGWLNCLMYALEVVYFFTLCIAKTNNILIAQKGLWTSSYNYVVRLAQKYMGKKALFFFKYQFRGAVKKNLCPLRKCKFLCRWENLLKLHKEKNLHYFSLCPLRPKGGCGLTDMSAKNVFGRLPLLSTVFTTGTFSLKSQIFDWWK